MEANHQPGEDSAVDGFQGLQDEVMLGAALPKVDLCGELDEEDGAVLEGVAAGTHQCES